MISSPIAAKFSSGWLEAPPFGQDVASGVLYYAQNFRSRDYRHRIVTARSSLRRERHGRQDVEQRLGSGGYSAPTFCHGIASSALV
jgi:hypothetical protein